MTDEKPSPDPRTSDLRCGVFGWKPKCFQLFNNMTMFMVCYIGLCLNYGMANSYTSSVIPSIEKRFGFTSQSMGVILAMNDVSHVLVALFTAHFLGSRHRPLWMSMGSFLIGGSLLLHASPEIFFPVKALSAVASIITSDEHEVFCLSESAKMSGGRLNNMSDVSNLKESTATETCKTEENIGPLIVFGLAQFLLGVGSTTLMILGLPFIDDNVEKKNTPIYLALSFSGRLFGPVLGYGLGALCNSIFLDWSDPGFKQTDPRWISAWYLGFLATGLGLFVFAVFMGCFPIAIPHKDKKSDSDSIKNFKMVQSKILESKTADQGSLTVKDLPPKLKRLVTNLAYMCRVSTDMLSGLIIAGYYGFLPKFLAQQYQLSQSVAALAGGVPGVFALAFGVVSGGFLIKRFKAQPRHVALMLSSTSLLMAVCFYGVIGLGCDKTEIQGLLPFHVASPGFSSPVMNSTFCTASSKCGCTDQNFSPVCDTTTGLNYYSPCFAGCETSSRINHTKSYQKCACVDNSLSDISKADHMVGGLCSKQCQNYLYIFIGVMIVAMYLSGLPMSGSIMINYRLVDPDLKSLATAISSLTMSGLGLLPGPIVVGAIVDSACKLWQTKSCGETGFCLLYNTDDFRWKLHVFAGSIKLISAVMEAIVTYKVWNLKFDRQETVSINQEVPAIAAISGLTQEELLFSTSDFSFDHGIDPLDLADSRL